MIDKDIRKWYSKWCRNTGRNPDGATVLVASSIQELLQDFKTYIDGKDNNLLSSR